MKQLVLLMLLLGGVVFSSQAQRRGWRGDDGYYREHHGREHHYREHHGKHKHWKRGRGYYRHGHYHNRVVVCRPAYPVYVAPPPPPPPPVVYYPSRPRVVIDAGITIVR